MEAKSEVDVVISPSQAYLAWPAWAQAAGQAKLQAAQCPVDSAQDFLIKLDMKPCMHLLEISIFSLNLVIVRLTKIMNRADKNWAQF